jgi:hypothetical protein
MGARRSKQKEKTPETLRSLAVKHVSPRHLEPDDLRRQRNTKMNIVKANKLFLEYAEEALHVMVEIMRDEENDASVRLKAANDIHNRAFGTPVNTSVQHQIREQAGAGTGLSEAAMLSASSDELRALADQLSKYVDAEENMVDITPDESDGKKS